MISQILTFGYQKKGKKLIPRYFLKLASSKNGIDWKFKKKIMKFKSKNEVAISRPWIIKHKNKYIMFYNGNNYGFDGIGLAVSK